MASVVLTAISVIGEVHKLQTVATRVLLRKVWVEARAILDLVTVAGEGIVEPLEPIIRREEAVG